MIEMMAAPNCYRGCFFHPSLTCSQHNDGSNKIKIGRIPDNILKFAALRNVPDLPHAPYPTNTSLILPM